MTAQKERATPEEAAQNNSKSDGYDAITILEAETVVAYRYQSAGFDPKNGSIAESDLTYSSREVSVSSLADIQRVFAEVHENPRAIAIMGRATSGTVKLTDEFEDRSSHIAIFEIGLGAKMASVESAINAMRQTLPKQFHALDCVWSVSPKKDPTDFQRAYLGFWMAEPRTLLQLSALVKLERCAQYQENRLPAPGRVLHLARPVFADGLVDPLETRQGRYHGNETPLSYSPAEGYTPKTVTICTAQPNKGRARFKTKVFGLRDGKLMKIDTPRPFLYRVDPRHLANLKEFSGLRQSLEGDPTKLSVLGAFVGDARATFEMNKSVRLTAGRGDGSPTNFVDREVAFVTFDIDQFQPFAFDPIADPEGAISEWVAAALPECFVGRSFDWALSSSAGLVYWETDKATGEIKKKDTRNTLKAHVTFEIETPYLNTVLEAWAVGINKAKKEALIDSTVFRTVQPHFIAGPVFLDENDCENPELDPLKGLRRSGYYKGPVGDTVPLVIDSSVLSDRQGDRDEKKTWEQRDAEKKSKPGLIGAWFRAFTNEEIVTDGDLLGDFFDMTNDYEHFDLVGATPGACFLRGDCFIGCNNDTWSSNFEDVVEDTWEVARVLKFGDLDHAEGDEESFETLGEFQIGSRPSDLAMKAWAAELPELKEAMAEAAAAHQSAVTALLAKITAAKAVSELTGPLAVEAKELLTEQPNPINKARIDSAIQARAKKLDGANLPIAAVRALTQPAPVAKKSSMLVDAGDQLGMARALKRAVFQNHRRERVAVRANGSWYVFNGQYYQELVSDEAINNAAWQFLPKLMCRDEEGGTFPLCPNKSLVAGVVDALRSELATDVGSPPAWLPGSEGPDPVSLLIMANGVLDIASGEIFEHTPRLFAVNALPYDFDPDATCPQWMTFLEQVLPGDSESHQLLQEWFGYCLTADTSQQKFLMLIGQKRSGKGTVGRILQAILGNGINTIGPTLASLSTNFGLQKWLGKLVAVFGDTRSGGKEPQIVVERILSIVGEDTLTVERKHRDDVTVRLPTRITILSNELLRLGDASGALIGRMLVLNFGQTFYGREDTTLEAKLLRELPGILNWALAGKRSLAKRGRFVQPATGNELLQDSHDANSPISVFVREHCEIDLMYEETQDRVFEAWQIHCRDENQRSGDKAQFAKNMKAAFPEFKIYRPRVGGVQPKTYQGVRLNAKMSRLVETYTPL